MNEHLARTVGARVRAARTARRQTQPVVAGLSGISSDYLYQIERGKKLPTLSVLTQLAAVLEVSTAELLSDTSVTGPSRAPASGAVDQLYRVLTGPPTPVELPQLAALTTDVHAAWKVWQTSPQRYSTLTAQLPELATVTEHAVRRYTSGDDALVVRRCAVDLYGLLRSVAKRLGRVDLSLLVADRAVRTAEIADDPHRLAAARWNLSHVLLADQQTEGAEAIAMHAADDLAPFVRNGDLDAMALSGSLALVGAVAGVRHGRIWAARERVRHAEGWARRTGERNVYWTAFGPTNVAMHAVSVEVETGDAVEGLRLAERIDHDQSPSIERRVAFLLEQARGYAQRQDYASTCLLLQTAGREAPEDIAYRPAARQLVTTVVRKGRRGVAREAAQLADRLGVAVG